jgi:hypothetical protein
MPLHKGCDRRFFTTAEEALQQLPIRQTGLSPLQRGLTKVLHDLAYLSGRHVASSVGFPRSAAPIASTFTITGTGTV